MWHAFLQGYIKMQKWYRLRFIYDKKLRKFKINPKQNPVYHWVNGQIFLVWLVSSNGIVTFLSSSEPPSDLGFVLFIMDLMYWGLMTLCLDVIWTLHFQRDEAVWFVNQMMTLKKPEGNFNFQFSYKFIF